ncbi:maleylpyruvate isomerase family mycothiol-dependent enzyme [Pseudonocardia sp.]|uniref:maleylpyruvate isomerase family mycothiol-dependent enzyme n=1 Tax=Pseudonocardia sp. TaxID=60912 RepID=UPI003D10C46A
MTTERVSTADRVIAAMRAEHTALVARVSSFDDDDLARRSAATEWDISQVLSHLGSGAELATAVLRAAVDGTSPPSPDAAPAVWARWDAMSRRQRADSFVPADEALTALYESLDDAARADLRIDLGFLPAPVEVATLGAMRLNELALHAWDVRAAFDDDATLDPATAAALLHNGPDIFAWIGKSDALGDRRAVVKVTTVDPASEFVLRLDAPIGVDLTPPGHVDGTLELAAESWLRLVAGRLAPRYTPEGVVATGAADLDLLRRVFPGY